MARPKNALKHGEMLNGIKSAEYSAYEKAKARCSPKSDKAKYYFQRGIEFRFANFDDFLQAVGRKPAPEYSLDRINNDGHYELGNLRWATRGQQMRNQSDCVFLTINGETRHLLEWVEEYGRKRYTVYQRRAKGWCDECCILIPPSQGICQHRIISK